MPLDDHSLSAFLSAAIFSLILRITSSCGIIFSGCASEKAAPYITEAYLHSVSIEANQFYREITGRFDVSLKWSNDYEITLEERGFSRPFTNLSGGEQMAAALSVRLALLKEFSDHLSLAFFDEPTTNMDEDRRRNLAQQIGRITGFRQLFVISHDDSFENFTDQVVVLGSRDGE